MDMFFSKKRKKFVEIFVIIDFKVIPETLGGQSTGDLAFFKIFSSRNGVVP
jgi:hypothetical protein